MSQNNGSIRVSNSVKSEMRIFKLQIDNISQKNAPGILNSKGFDTSQ